MQPFSKKKSRAGEKGNEIGLLEINSTENVYVKLQQNCHLIKR